LNWVALSRRAAPPLIRRKSSIGLNQFNDKSPYGTEHARQTNASSPLPESP
jgi:hypothetical protein